MHFSQTKCHIAILNAYALRLALLLFEVGVGVALSACAVTFAAVAVTCLSCGLASLDGDGANFEGAGACLVWAGFDTAADVFAAGCL